MTLFPGLQAKEGKRAELFIEESIFTKAYADDGDKADQCVGDSAFAKGFKTFLVRGIVLINMQ